MAVLDSADLRLRHPEKAHRPDLPVSQKPDWIRVKAPGSPGYAETRRIVRANGLHTVCVEASCPNIGECWEKKHATFMIMGDTCLAPAPSATSRPACRARSTARSRNALPMRSRSSGSYMSW